MNSKGIRFYSLLLISALFAFFSFPESGGAAVKPMISAGAKHTAAIKSDGTLWAWGGTANGQLVNYNIPIQIGTATNWLSVSAGTAHTLAIKSDGTLWAWGYNGQGQLGDGTTIDMTTPVQIGSATNWSSVSAGGSHTIALKSDGTLWAWGYNGQGQLGDGTTIDMTTPVQIGTATNWLSVSAGVNHTIALKSDGTLWAWGYNYYGQLGDGTTISRASPVQIVQPTDPLTLGTPLNVNITGTGSGSVTSSPAGISCSVNCSTLYPLGTVVTLTAVPNTGSTFMGWSGACTGTGTCQLTLDVAKGATAEFKINTYTVTPSAGAGGTISPSIPQTVNYNGSTSFTVTPDAGYTAFVGGSCGGTLTGNTYTTNVITGDCTVSATFALPVSNATLTVNPSSPQPIGTQVTFIAGGSGGSGNYQYKFSLKTVSGIAWTVQDYSSNNTWTWNTSGYDAGRYNIQVFVRNIGSTASYEANSSVGYTLNRSKSGDKGHDKKEEDDDRKEERKDDKKEERRDNRKGDRR